MILKSRFPKFQVPFEYLAIMFHYSVSKLLILGDSCNGHTLNWEYATVMVVGSRDELSVINHIFMINTNSPVNQSFWNRSNFLFLSLE